jgi:hypothetical protein
MYNVTPRCEHRRTGGKKWGGGIGGGGKLMGIATEHMQNIFEKSDIFKTLHIFF